MFDFLAGKAVMILGTLLGALTIAFALHYNITSNKIENLLQQNTILTANNETLKANYSTLEKQVKDLNENISELEKAKNDIIEINEAEKNVFDNHNMEILLKKKPSLMEKKINKATAEVFKKFEE